MSTNYNQAGLDYLLGLYDQAFQNNFLKLLTYRYVAPDGSLVYTPYPNVFASPERNYVAIANLVAKSTGQSVTTTATPRPFLSVVRNITQFVDSRYVFPGWLTALYDIPTGVYHVDETYIQQYLNGQLAPGQAQVVRQRYPLPIDMVYTVNAWAKNIRHLDDLSVAIWRLFRDKLFMLLVPFDIPPGPQKLALTHEDEADGSNLEPGAEDNRILRRIYKFSLRAWIFDIPDNIPNIMTIDTSIQDGNQMLADLIISAPVPA